MNEKIRNMCFIALMAAVLCIAAPVSVPIGPIPITLATFVIYLAGAILGCGKGTLAVLLYILIGGIGLPVFAGYTSGFAKIVGPTGGFMVGYVPCAAITGFGVDRFSGRQLKIAGHGIAPAYPLSMIAGTVVLYALGTVWYMIEAGSTLTGALALCVIPFLPGDIVKIVLASVLGGICRSRLTSLGILHKAAKKEAR